VVNTFIGVDGDSWDALEITLNDGTVVPATRRTATKRGEQRCIFQNFAYKVAPAL
jgi:hypothetical protein